MNNQGVFYGELLAADGRTVVVKYSVYADDQNSSTWLETRFLDPANSSDFSRIKAAVAAFMLQGDAATDRLLLRLRREDRLVAAITAELDTVKGGFKLISKEASAPSSSSTPASGLKRPAASPPPSVPPAAPSSRPGAGIRFHPMNLVLQAALDLPPSSLAFMIRNGEALEVALPSLAAGPLPPAEEEGSRLLFLQMLAGQLAKSVSERRESTKAIDLTATANVENESPNPIGASP